MKFLDIFLMEKRKICRDLQITTGNPASSVSVSRPSPKSDCF